MTDEESEIIGAPAPRADIIGAQVPRADISSAEIEALLQKAKPAIAGSPVPQPYDLVARDKIVRRRMPVLDRLNERWSRSFSASSATSSASRWKWLCNRSR
jgi:hypothetical protein